MTLYMIQMKGAANPSRVPQILVGTIIPTVLSSVFVAARLYTRGILNKTWGLDDTLVTTAWVRNFADFDGMTTDSYRSSALARPR
jgi:hypothetical protein